MTVKRPTPEQLRAVADDLGITMSDADIASYLAIMQPNFLAYDAIEATPDYLPEVNIRARPATSPRARRTSTTPGTLRPR